MVQRSKSFKRQPPPKYYYVGGDTSCATAYYDHDLEMIIDTYRREGIDLRVYKLQEQYRFSGEKSPRRTEPTPTEDESWWPFTDPQEAD